MTRFYLILELEF